MELAWFALGALLGAFLAAAAVGSYLRRPPALVVREEVPVSAPPPRVAVESRHVALTEEHLEEARAIAWALLAEGGRATSMLTSIDHDSDLVEAAAREIALLIDRGWEMGAEDLRGALVEYSGLPPELIDQAVRVALQAIAVERPKRLPDAPAVPVVLS